ncbi:MAG: HupE/UreJ family protein [Acidobacteriota bacterium]
MVLGIRHILSGLDHLLFVLGVQPLRTPAAYLIGAISTYWCLHRGAVLLAGFGL